MYEEVDLRFESSFFKSRESLSLIATFLNEYSRSGIKRAFMATPIEFSSARLWRALFSEADLGEGLWLSILVK